jgi:ribosome biogenesis GTPase / thiamine phosphate phosphatase
MAIKPCAIDRTRTNATRVTEPLTPALTLADYGWSGHFDQAGAELGLAHTIPARVMMVHRDALDVAGPAFSGRIHQMPLQAKRDHQSEDLPTTGDWVALDPNSHKLLALYPRTSLFKRLSAGTTSRTQLIAANVDTVFFVTSANHDFSVPRLERYLALAQEADVAPVVVITKSDLTDETAAYADLARGIRAELPIVTLDARSADVVALLAPWLRPGQTIALLGSSGVGKSTIVNSLMGEAVQHTQGIRERDSRGRHTTSGRSLHRIAGGAWLMDTPGMRELQIVDATSGIEAVFDDIAQLVAECRFSDCSHTNEPACAIREALAAGELDPARLERFQKLQRDGADAATTRQRRGGAGRRP